MTNDYLHQHRIPLVLRIVSNPDLRTGRVLERVAHLLLGQQLRRFKVHAVQRVEVEDDLLSSTVQFVVDDAAVGDPSVHE